MALAILVAADLLDSTLDQELWIGPGQHATVTASNLLLTKVKVIVSNNNISDTEQTAGRMCFTDFLLQALARALDLWHWPKGSQPTPVKSQSFPHLQHTGCLPRLSVQGTLSYDACQVVSSKFH